MLPFLPQLSLSDFKCFTSNSHVGRMAKERETFFPPIQRRFHVGKSTQALAAFL